MKFNNIISNPQYEYLCSMYIFVTEQCNLRCEYCFEKGCNYNGGVMDENTASNTIEYLFKETEKRNLRVKNLGFSNKDMVHVILFGGEPLLNVKVCKTILKRLKENSEKFNIGVDVGIITNGTLWNPEIEKFYEYWSQNFDNVYIQLSYDGIPEIQDKNRPTITREKSSHEIIEEVSKQYISFEKSHKNVDILTHGVVTHKTLEYLSDNYKYLYNLLGGPKSVFAWAFESDWEPKDIAILENELSVINKFLISNNQTWMRDICSYPMVSSEMNSDCLAGRGGCCIGANGDISLCHRLYTHDDDTRKKYTIGNVNTAGVDSTLPVVKEWQCIGRIAEKQYSCGSCWATNLIENKDPNKIVNETYMSAFNSVVRAMHKAYNDECRLIQIQNEINLLQELCENLNSRLERFEKN